MSEWIDFDPESFEDIEADREGYLQLTSRAPVDEWKCTECGKFLGWLSDDEGGGWWVSPFCPTQEFDEATMRCEDCVPEDDDEVELIPGVDYEVACCPICERSDAHSDCDDLLGSFGPRPYPHHDEDDSEVEVGCAVCGEVGLPIIGHADTCRGSA